VDYWDTSAALKLYVAEAESGYFLDLIAASDQPIATSAIASAEFLCALLRKEAEGDLKRGTARSLFRRFRSDCAAGRVLLIPYGNDVLEEAEKLARLAYERHQPTLIRSLDLIHMASAVSAGARRIVVTDQRLRALAALLKIEALP
jgi:uncharacterized protein